MVVEPKVLGRAYLHDPHEEEDLRFVGRAEWLLPHNGEAGDKTKFRVQVGGHADESRTTPVWLVGVPGTRAGTKRA